MDCRPLPLFAPVSTNSPPRNSLRNIVLPESRDRAGAISSLSTGVSFSSGSSRWRFSRFAMSRVGCTNSVGAGHRWMIAPSQFSTTSVLPSCEPNMSTTRRHGLDGLRHCIGSRRYGVRSVRHGPGSLLPLLLSIR